MAVLERKITHGMTTLCSHISYPRFVLPLHKHAEFEIMLFTKGSGKQFVGEGVSDYRPICDLLQKSLYGVRFYDEGVYDDMQEMLKELDNTTHTARIICLLRMLDRLNHCRHTELLSDTAYNSSNLMSDVEEPINKVYAYLYNHFKEDISLQDIAGYVKQNPSALCRYFKQRTDKSIFQCLAEIRIEHACKLLAYSGMTVSQVAYESGYNSLTHFIAQFERHTKQRPLEYRTQIKL